jgi:hypothetical protein
MRHPTRGLWRGKREEGRGEERHFVLGEFSRSAHKSGAARHRGFALGPPDWMVVLEEQ